MTLRSRMKSLFGRDIEPRAIVESDDSAPMPQPEAKADIRSLAGQVHSYINARFYEVRLATLQEAAAKEGFELVIGTAGDEMPELTKARIGRAMLMVTSAFCTRWESPQVVADRAADADRTGESSVFVEHFFEALAANNVVPRLMVNPPHDSVIATLRRTEAGMAGDHKREPVAFDDAAWREAWKDRESAS